MRKLLSKDNHSLKKSKADFSRSDDEEDYNILANSQKSNLDN
jgi:hypothetical protein